MCRPRPDPPDPKLAPDPTPKLEVCFLYPNPDPDPDPDPNPKLNPYRYVICLRQLVGEGCHDPQRKVQRGGTWVRVTVSVGSG